MLKIPYISSPENACALACYTMTAKYFFPEATFNQIAKISNWTPKYVVWPYKFWKWILEKGIKIVDYDTIDHQGWADHGVEALKNSISTKDYEWLMKNSLDLNEVGKDIKSVFANKNFTSIRSKPTFEILDNAFKKDSVCEVIVDARTLDRKKGYSLHRVVVTDITPDKIVFHDPREIPRPNKVESKKHFIKAWLGSADDPELCIYSK